MNKEALEALNQLIIDVAKSEQTKTNPDLLRELTGLVGNLAFINKH